jgi:hypothetical protein
MTANQSRHGRARPLHRWPVKDLAAFHAGWEDRLRELPYRPQYEKAGVAFQTCYEQFWSEL